MIHNGLKRKISFNSDLEMLPMVLESNTARCASEDTGPQGRWGCEISHRLEKETKHFFYKSVKTSL